MLSRGFGCSGRVKIKEIKMADRYLDLPRELRKTVKHEREYGNNCSVT